MIYEDLWNMAKVKEFYLEFSSSFVGGLILCQNLDEIGRKKRSNVYFGLKSVMDEDNLADYVHITRSVLST